MFHPWPARWLATLPALAVLTSVAQTAPPGPEANEAQPPLVFRSAFDGYRPFKDEPAMSWKEANDTVRARGGWRAYAEEAAGRAPPEGTPAGNADPHAGHGGSGGPGGHAGHQGHAMPMPAQQAPRP